MAVPSTCKKIALENSKKLFTFTFNKWVMRFGIEDEKITVAKHFVVNYCQAFLLRDRWVKAYNIHCNQDYIVRESLAFQDGY